MMHVHCQVRNTVSYKAFELYHIPYLNGVFWPIDSDTEDQW